MFIEDFLGQHTPSTPIELSNEASNTLISPITATEVQKIIDSLGIKTARGPNNIPNLLLKSTAKFFINLITNTFNSVFLGDEKFPDEFKISKIVLIPKKSSPSNIRNWRPISIGNSIYKIYTKLIGRRLASALPTLLGLEQKAYTSKSNISEATCNIIESLAFLNSHARRPVNGNNMLVAIDWKKAFDSLNHDFIAKALHYFKFPTAFINAINKWLSCRKSTIIVDGNP